MFPSKQHDSRVVYVAGSARDFPEPVQEWLSQADHRAAASLNVYDALAGLTGRRRPVATANRGHGVLLCCLCAVRCGSSRSIRVDTVARPGFPAKLASRALVPGGLPGTTR